ncbi:MAG: hypothetical protein A4E32_01787 [Methanomassiliicoccales archaeon PtaU1.Bin124]|nr:MAG: hypothetical protein A4E32_01787 [Methanomassiliicoccales archaeon PtaU1.Bin124]
MNQVAEEVGQQLSIVRWIDASKNDVWDAWTEPEQIMEWWGPEYFTAPSAKVDLRVGGHYLFCMRDPQGKDYWSTGVYKEIADRERIVATDSFSDDKGNIVPAVYYGMPGNWPEELLLTVTFKEVGGRTRLHLHHTGLPPGDVVEQTAAGWNGSLDKLEDFLLAKRGKPKGLHDEMTFMVTNEREIKTRNIINAYPEDVFIAYVDPEMIPNWWGPRELMTSIVKLDARQGGEWRFVQQDAKGNVYGFHGKFIAVEPPHRIVQTMEYEGMPGHVMAEEMTIDNLEGRSLIRTAAKFETHDDMKGMVVSDMERGVFEGMERLQEVFAKKEKITIKA